MANLIIRLVVDAVTKKKNVIISYTSDADALPLEHEEAHRGLVDRLIEGGALKAAELGRVIIERETSGEGVASDRSDEEAAPRAQKRGT